MNKPSIVLLDIESSPIIGYSWELFDANILKVLEPSKIISVSWKDLSDKQVTVKCVADYKGYKKGPVNDEALIKEVWHVLDNADVVIGHHSDSFDLKKLNARFVFYGLNSPSPYQTIDTLKLSKKYFKFDSNSLNNICQYLGLGQKVENGGFNLWVRCLDGDLAAWELMKKYNTQDVILLEKLYLTLRPFQMNHPDLNLITETPKSEACPTCQSDNTTKRGFSRTRASIKQRFQCSDCASWFSGPLERVKISQDPTPAQPEGPQERRSVEKAKA